MNSTFLLFGFPFLLPNLGLGLADTPSVSRREEILAGERGPGMDWLTGEKANIAGVLFPHFHFHSVYGGTSADEVEDFGAGHHDPQRDGWTIQGFELGLSGRFGEHFESFLAGHVFYDREEGEWDGEMEEWFGKVKGLPFDLEMRGGRYLNRFGLHNAVHLHGWDFADNQLVNGRFLGDDGLYTIGGELTWTLPFDSATWTSLLSVSVGKVPQAHHHHHEEGEEEDAPEFEGEGAQFDDLLTVANWTNVYRFNDFRQIRAGLSGAWGDNAFGLQTQVYGGHFEWQWRENGLEVGGKYLRWRTEAMYRHFEARSGHLPGEEEYHEEDEHEHEHEEPVREQTFDEFGACSSVVFGVPTRFAGPLELALRGEYVGGVSAAGGDERWRVTPGVRLFYNAARTAYVGVQYNFDHSNDHGSDHSIWLQIGINWGPGGEVR